MYLADMTSRQHFQGRIRVKIDIPCNYLPTFKPHLHIHASSRCDLYYKIRMDNTVNSEITTMSHIVPMCLYESIVIDDGATMVAPCSRTVFVMNLD